MAQSTDNLLPENLQPPPRSLTRPRSVTPLILDETIPVAPLSRQASHVVQRPNSQLLEPNIQHLQPNLEQTGLYRMFYDRFAATFTPGAFLKLVEQFRNSDTSDVLLCLKLECPKLLLIREQLFSALEPICQLFTVTFEKPEDTFWNQSVKRCIRKCRTEVQCLVPPYDTASYAEQVMKLEAITHHLQKLSDLRSAFEDALKAVNEKLSILDEAKDDIRYLISNFERYELRLAQGIEKAKVLYDKGVMLYNHIQGD